VIVVFPLIVYSIIGAGIGITGDVLLLIKDIHRI
jgi:hypothetical protein